MGENDLIRGKQPLISKKESGNDGGALVPGFDAELGNRLKWVVDRIGSQKAAGVVADVKAEMIGKYLAGKAKPSFYSVRALAGAAGVRLDWLASGEGDPYEGATAPSPADQATVMVPHYDLALSAGSGAFNDGNAVTEFVPFPNDILRRLVGRASAEGLAIVDARGDSMEPTIGDGDLVLIDTHDKTLQDGLMAFAIDDVAYIKRLRPMVGGGVEVISDNDETYKPQALPRERLADLRVFGRVRWVGRAL